MKNKFESVFVLFPYKKDRGPAEHKKRFQVHAKQSDNRRFSIVILKRIQRLTLVEWWNADLFPFHDIHVADTYVCLQHVHVAYMC